ncbi:MAG: alkaline phosphatase family protein [Myxococcota bacterium]
MTQPRLAMIGLDAAELEVIQAALPRLPRLRRLLEAAPAARLESTAGLLPGSVWPTFFTGEPPGVHGIHHHLQWDADRMGLRRVAADWLDANAFWSALDAAGHDVCVVDVPMTVRNGVTRGIEIANWGSHDELRAFGAAPARVGRELRRRFGRHPMGPEIPVRKTPAELARIRRNLVEGARRKGELARWLYGLREWDLFLCVFGETHRGGHILWPERPDDDALDDVYRAVDAAVGTLLDALAPETVVVLFALHGMGPNTSQEHFVPAVMDRVNARLRSASAERPVPPPRPGLVRLLRERVPAGLQNTVARAVPVAVRDWVVDRQIRSGHDWSATPGFASLADLNGYLRFNLRGRERKGALEPDGPEHRATRSAWERGFESLRHGETGEPLVDALIFEHPALRGPRRARLPDAIVTWRAAPPAERVDSAWLGSLDGQRATGRGGNHRAPGFVSIVDPAGRLPALPPPRHIADFAGWVRSALGVG